MTGKKLWVNRKPCGYHETDSVWDPGKPTVTGEAQVAFVQIPGTN